jgi:glutamine---fructose-6-phosphate transaminase (isomerizing)
MTTNSMIAQIHRQPQLLREVFPVIDERVRNTLDHELCLSLKRILVTGCGDSHHAALGSELAFEVLAGVPTQPLTAMQLARYNAGFLAKTGPQTNLAIGISVSGSVTRTAEALTMSEQGGASTLALTATPGSTVANAAKMNLIIPVPDFPVQPGVLAVPGVRTYLINLVALLLMAVRIGEVRGHIVFQRAANIRHDILGLAEAIETTIKFCDEKSQELAFKWKNNTDIVFTGSGPNYATALFSAAKLMEATGDNAIGQDTEEWAHLQYFCKRSETPTFILTAGDRDLSRVVEIAKAARTIGRQTVAIAPQEASELLQQVDQVLPTANVREIYSPLITSIASELFAAHKSDAMGEPFFRNFGGGRSEEGGSGASRIRDSLIWDKWANPWD